MMQKKNILKVGRRSIQHRAFTAYLVFMKTNFCFLKRRLFIFGVLPHIN